MPQKIAQLSVADNLVRLAKEFQSGDPNMAAALKKEFKGQSKNDLIRTVVYLMEVIGSRDEQFKRIESDNKDLKEILKLNNIDLDEGYEELNEKEKKDGVAPSPEGSNGVAATGITENSGGGGSTDDGGTAEASSTEPQQAQESETANVSTQA